MPSPSEKQIVVASDPRWAHEGLFHARRVRDALAVLGADVDHIGSTAVAGLAAKDVIDLQALVVDLQDERLTPLLTAIGFAWRPDVVADTPRADYVGTDAHEWTKLYFVSGPTLRRIHLHVRRMGAVNATLALMQRDFLRAEPLVRAEWEQLKWALATHTHDAKIYAALKEPATTLLLRLARQWAERTRWRPGVSDAPAGEQ